MSLQSDDTSLSPRMNSEEEEEQRGHTHCFSLLQGSCQTPLVLFEVTARADELLRALIKTLHIQNGIKVTD